MKNYSSLIPKLLAISLLIVTSCKNENLTGPKITEPTSVYLPYATKDTVNILDNGLPALDSVAMTANFKVPVYRGGEGDLGQVITVDVAFDNSKIDSLKAAGKLSKAVTLDPSDLVLPATDTLEVDGTGHNPALVGANIKAALKLSSLTKYAGKTIAFGVKISNASGPKVNEAQDVAVITINIDDLADAVTPKTNMVVPSAWIIGYNGGTNSHIEVTGDSTIFKFTGTSNAAVMYQSFQIRGGKHYKLDMNIVGGPMSNSWFEVYADTAVPVVPGPDYTKGNSTNLKRLAFSGYGGVGQSPFNGVFSQVGDPQNNNIISYPSDCTLYVLIRSGINAPGTYGPNGITISNIDFRRQD